MAEDKNGKIKVTFEVEINEAAMELIKENTGNLVNAVSQSMASMRSKGSGQNTKTDESSSTPGVAYNGQD